MKHHFLLLLIAALSMTACKQSGNKTMTDQAGTYISSNAKDKKEAKIVQASVLAPLIGTWEVQASTGISSKGRRQLYEGRWYTLRGDQTFTYGVFETETSNGVFEYDGDSNLLDLYYDAPEAGVASQFEIKGLGVNDSSVTIWLGNTPKNPQGMQLKMVKADNPNIQ